MREVVIADTGPLVAFLVRLAELHDKPRVWTIDSDFRVYRRLGRLVIPTLTPNEQSR